MPIPRGSKSFERKLNAAAAAGVQDAIDRVTDAEWRALCHQPYVVQEKSGKIVTRQSGETK